MLFVGTDRRPKCTNEKGVGSKVRERNDLRKGSLQPDKTAGWHTARTASSLSRLVDLWLWVLRRHRFSLALSADIRNCLGDAMHFITWGGSTVRGLLAELRGLSWASSDTQASPGTRSFVCIIQESNGFPSRSK